MNLSGATIKYIDRPFSACGCIEFVVEFMAEIGKPLPDEVSGIDVNNYRQLVEDDIKTAQVTMLKTFRKIGTRSSCRYPGIGDLLVVLQKNRMAVFPAVYLGGGSAIASFIRTGVCIFNVDKHNLPIMAREVECQRLQ